MIRSPPPGSHHPRVAVGSGQHPGTTTCHRHFLNPIPTLMKIQTQEEENTTSCSSSTQVPVSWLQHPNIFRVQQCSQHLHHHCSSWVSRTVSGGSHLNGHETPNPTTPAAKKCNTSSRVHVCTQKSLSQSVLLTFQKTGRQDSSFPQRSSTKTKHEVHPVLPHSWTFRNCTPWTASELQLCLFLPVNLALNDFQSLRRRERSTNDRDVKPNASFCFNCEKLLLSCSRKQDLCRDKGSKRDL